MSNKIYLAEKEEVISLKDNLVTISDTQPTNPDSRINIRQTTNYAEVPTREAFEGLAEDVASLKEDVSQQSESITEISNRVFSNSDIEIVDISNVPNSYKMSQESVGIGETYVSLTFNKNFQSYIFYAFRDGDLYVGNDILSLSYCAIVKANNPTGEWYDYSSTVKRLSAENAVRYRISESNLPTESKKLNISKGDIVIITVPSTSGTLKIYGSVFNNNLNDTLGLSGKQKIEVAEIVTNGKKYTVTKTSNANYDISFGGYVLHYAQTDTGGFDRWNLLGVECDGVELVTSATDIIGPIRESNNLYIGGVHGREHTTLVAIIADGTPISLSVGESVQCKRLDIIHESDVTSTVTNEVTWHRFYHLTFDDVLTVENNYKCINANGTVVKRATNGGIFGSPNDITSAIALTNKFYPVPPTSESTETIYVDDCTEATWYYNNGHSITVENLVGREKSGYKCILTIYGTENPKRTKIYYLSIDASKNFANNEVLYGKFALKFE